VYREPDGMFLSLSDVFDTRIDAAVIFLQIADDQCTSVNAQATS